MKSETMLISDKTERTLRLLARELVKNLREPNQIMKDLGLDQDTFDRIQATTSFKAMLQEAALEWEGAANTKQRIAMKAAIMVETALPEMFNELTNDKEPLSSRVAFLQSLAKLGNLEPDKVPQVTGDVFRLEINFGPGKELVLENAIPPKVIDAKPVEGLDGET